MTKPLTFLVVDDHPVFRQGLVALIRSDDRYEVCAEAGTAAETLAALERAVPDIALIDISLVGQNGLDLVKTLKAAHPEILVLIISMHDEVIYAERALKAGARGYVMKQEAASVMLDAIKTVLSGKIYVSATMRDRLLETMFSARDEADSHSVERLSDRELEVLELMGQGYGAAGERLEWLQSGVYSPPSRAARLVPLSAFPYPRVNRIPGAGLRVRPVVYESPR